VTEKLMEESLKRVPHPGYRPFIPRAMPKWLQEYFWPGRKDCENVWICEETALSKCCIFADLKFYLVEARSRFRLNI
jgi:hypothetical protein